MLITCQIKHWPQKMKNLEDEINESVSGLIDERGINLRPDLRKKIKNIKQNFMNVFLRVSIRKTQSDYTAKIEEQKRKLENHWNLGERVEAFKVLLIITTPVDKTYFLRVEIFILV